jgi:hypothetical protein
LKTRYIAVGARLGGCALIVGTPPQALLVPGVPIP